MGLELWFIILGYLSGSILFARIAARIMKVDGMFPDSQDGNPGAANAFSYGGFWCGMITLLGDIAKGFIPVYLYLRSGGSFEDFSLYKSAVLAAPIAGHIFPLFFGFRGGKGIAVTFGCLLGLLPEWKPVVLLAACFLFYSIFVRITPNFYRTVVTYLTASLGSLLLRNEASVTLGFLWITVLVLWRLYRSEEQLSPMEVTRIWTH